MIGNKTDIIISGEPKLDESFSRAQFRIPGFKMPYRLDENARSGSLMVMINENISSKTLNGIDIALDMQIIPVELNLLQRSGCYYLSTGIHTKILRILKITYSKRLTFTQQPTTMY